MQPFVAMQINLFTHPISYLVITITIIVISMLVIPINKFKTTINKDHKSKTITSTTKQIQKFSRTPRTTHNYYTRI